MRIYEILRTRPSVNSLGQPITNPDKFWKWFGNSTTVDEMGRPIVFHHGTNAEMGRDFSFNLKFKGLNGTSGGAGFYFITDHEVASAYGKVISCYIRAVKPLDIHQKIFPKEVMRKLLDAIVREEAKLYDHDIGDGYLSNWGDVQHDGYNRVLNTAINALSNNTNVVDQFNELIGAGVDAALVNRILKEVTGYDVIIADPLGAHDTPVYIVLNPQDIKAITSQYFDPGSTRIFS